MTTSLKSNLLFVYGTLRKGPRNDMYLTLACNSTYLGGGRVHGELYDLGEYPGIILKDGCREVVLGEVYAINGKDAFRTWRVLDDYEGCGPDEPEPHEYTRKTVHVVLFDGKEVDAWAYILKTLPGDAVRVPDGDYLVWI